MDGTQAKSHLYFESASRIANACINFEMRPASRLFFAPTITNRFLHTRHPQSAPKPIGYEIRRLYH